MLKSDDVNYKFDYAKRAYEEGRYVQAATLLKDCITLLKGSDKAEESLYLLAMSHFENKDYVSSGAKPPASTADTAISSTVPSHSSTRPAP